MSVGDRFCVSGKGTGGGGWGSEGGLVHLRGTNNMGVSGLVYEKPLVGAR